MAYKIITREDVMKSKNNTPVEGLLLMRTYQEKPTQSGSSAYLVGSAEGLGSVPFKVWAGETFDKMKDTDYSNQICYVKALVNDYNNMKSIIIDSVELYNGDEFCNMDFLERKYDEDALWSSLTRVIKNCCSEEAVKVFELVISPIEERFRQEFAAVNHHDNCVNGLLAHTSRVVKIAQVVKFYPVIQDSVTMDALMIGCALHDIGKVLEYNNGSMSEEGKLLNHLALGLNLVTPYKKEIVSLKGINFYNTLLSVIQQHHGQYGERPKTLASYLVHMFDMLESKLTDASESITNSGTDTIKCEDFYLHFDKPIKSM